MPDSLSFSGTSSRPVEGFSLAKTVTSLVKLVIITGVILIGLIPLIYFHGADSPHQIDEHPLYQLFEESSYQQLYKQLNKKSSNRLILRGTVEGGLRHFVTHYANKLTEKGKNVIVEQLHAEDMRIRPYVKQAKYYIQDQINIEPDLPTVWILISPSEFPTVEVNQLTARNSRDRILIATEDKSQAPENFKVLTFSPVKSDDFQREMIQALNVSSSQAGIIYDHFRSMETLFNLVDQDMEALQSEKLLGEHYRSLELLSDSDKQVLGELCKEGQGKAAKSSKTLDAFGCIFYQKKYYWDHDLAQLNYELQVNKNCPKDGVMPKAIRDKMNQEIRQQQEEENRKKRTEQKDAPKKQKDKTDKEKVEKSNTEKPKNEKQKVEKLNTEKPKKAEPEKKPQQDKSKKTDKSKKNSKN